MNDLTEQLQQAAGRTGLSINALAHKADLPYQTVHGFMTADRKITLESAAKLARVLGLALRPIRSKTPYPRKGK